MTRVFVAAATSALRLRLRTRLEGPEITVVGDGATPDSAPADVDVVVLGDAPRLLVSGSDPIDGAGHAIVVVTDDANAVPILRARPLRGWAVVGADVSAAELRAAVAAAAQGFTVLPTALAGRALAARPGAREAAPDELPEPLTPRERETLELLGQGLSNRAIAERLGVSEHTAKFHVASVSAKLGASSRTEAVSRGVRRGLITL
jgi:DNA-binding NarL/FixJ family response regulator